jgi:hypothetical protein
MLMNGRDGGHDNGRKCKVRNIFGNVSSLITLKLFCITIRTLKNVDYIVCWLPNGIQIIFEIAVNHK